MNATQWATLVFLLVFIGIMLYLGVRGNRVSTDFESYAVGRGLFGPITLGMAYAATQLSSVVFIGMPGWVYTSGVSGLWNTFPFWFFTILGMIVMAKGFRRMTLKYGAITLPDWLGKRYESHTVRVVASLVMLFTAFYVASQFIGIGILFESIAGVPYIWGIVGGLIVVLIYVTIGGTYADIVTDAVQSGIMFVFSLFVLSMGFWAIRGGWDGTINSLESQNPLLVQPFNPEFPLFASPLAVAAVCLVGVAFAAQGHLMKIFMAIRSERDFRIFMVTAVVMFACLFNVLTSGLYARALYPNLAAPDTALPALVAQVANPLFSAFFIAALIAVILSTTDGLFVALGTSFANDLYKGSLEARRSQGGTFDESRIDRNAIWISRGVMVVLGIVALLLAIRPPEYLATLGAFGSFAMMVGFIGPVVMGVYWRRATALGALAGMLAGVLTFVICQGTLILNPSIYVNAAIGVLASVAGVIVVSKVQHSLEGTRTAKDTKGGSIESRNG